MRIAYADPPYPGQAKKHYGDHPDYAGEVDHRALVEQLRGFDGWVLHTSSTALADIAPMVPEARVFSWVKPFAAFKRNVSVAYAWEPVFVKAARKPEVDPRIRQEKGIVSRDWLAEPITLKRGLTGAKPERVCWWLLQALGARPEDDFHDLFPGTGAVARAWETWKEFVGGGGMEGGTDE